MGVVRDFEINWYQLILCLVPVDTLLRKVCLLPLRHRPVHCCGLLHEVHLLILVLLTTILVGGDFSLVRIRHRRDHLVFRNPLHLFIP